LIQIVNRLVEHANATPAQLAHLHLFVAQGTQYYRYNPTANGNDGTTYDEKNWEKVYNFPLTDEQVAKITKAIEESAKELDLWEEDKLKEGDEIIENRLSQVTFSALGQKADTDVKYAWDPDCKKREKIVAKAKEKAPEFEGHKFHKATQDELKANDVPIIPDGTGSNKIGSVKWELGDNYPWIEYAYADKSEHKFIKDYVLGNVFRPDKDGDLEINIIDRERSVYNRIYSLYNKQLDWAWIERAVYNNYRRTCYNKAGNSIFKKEWDITKSASDWKKYLGNTTHILYSKFGKERFYYHFAFCGNKFRIVKVLFTIEQDNDIVFERACMDYALGNFFISKKDAKRSLMFQKIKTFFKYDEI
jgi:hypothetical protein